MAIAIILRFIVLVSTITIIRIDNLLFQKDEPNIDEDGNEEIVTTSCTDDGDEKRKTRNEKNEEEEVAFGSCLIDDAPPSANGIVNEEFPFQEKNQEEEFDGTTRLIITMLGIGSLCSK